MCGIFLSRVLSTYFADRFVCVSDVEYVDSAVPLLTVNVMADWPKEAILCLIQQVQLYPFLYDFKHPCYHHRSSRQNALDRIKDIICVYRQNTTSQDIKVRWHALRSTFHNDLVKSQTSGKPSQLWYFEEMQFLRKFLQTKKCLNGNNATDAIRGVYTTTPPTNLPPKTKPDVCSNVIEIDIKPEQPETQQVIPEESEDVTRVSVDENSSVAEYDSNWDWQIDPVGPQDSPSLKRPEETEIPTTKIYTNDVSYEENSDIIFAKFIATELKGFRSKRIKMECKHNILHQIMLHQNKDFDNE